MKTNFFLRSIAIFFVCSFLFSAGQAKAEVSSINFNPDLDVSFFGTYTIQSDITGSPTSVTANIESIPGNGTYWDYYADGTPVLESVEKNFSYNGTSGKWEAQVRPDQIYPEIFFADSSITWNEPPESAPIRKNDYQIMHYVNNFTMVPDMSFFIEINALPNTASSSNLDVYVVGQGNASSFFESNWRNDAAAELVASYDASSAYDHTHTANSSHRLIKLQANADSTVGSKHINVANDFWIVLMNNAAQNNKAWTLKFQPSPICNNTNGWYTGTQAGWNIAPSVGCPDAHIHVARRGLTNADGVRVSMTATYDGLPQSSLSTTFSFEPLPNFPPNTTSFVTPMEDSTYKIADGPIEIAWNPATDPNADPLVYSIYLDDGSALTPLVSDTSSTSYSWDPSLMSPGSYGLKGEVCDDGTPSLCTDFFLDNFNLVATTIYSLSSVSVTSSNTDAALAMLDDVITLSFEATGDVSSNLYAQFYSGGVAITPVELVSAGGNNWTATHTVTAADQSGTLSFIISSDDLDAVYSDTTDASYVVIDSVTGRPVSDVLQGGGSYPYYSGTPVEAPPYEVPQYVYSDKQEQETTPQNDGTPSQSIEGKNPTTEPVIPDETVKNQEQDEQRTPKKESFMMNLRYGMVHSEVLRLQKYLNGNGYILSKDGAGSPGHETSFYGPLTRYAVILLQKDLLGYGTGFFGPLTRAALNAKQ